jgi:uncharacterized protein YndB with AHSA1/START domain
MNNSTRGFAVRVDVAGADAARVWRAVTEGPCLERWCGAGSKLVGRAGGEVKLLFDRQARMQARVDICEPARRLRLIHMPGSVVASPDSALIDDLLIESRPPLAVVRVLCSGLPAGSAYDAASRAHQLAWRQALARLKVFLEKRMDEEIKT